MDGPFRDKVVLYVNCQPIGEKPMEIVDSRIDLNGEIVVSKEVESRRTHPIDLQWMVMTCDPQSAERETCDELPVYKFTLCCISLRSLALFQRVGIREGWVPLPLACQY